MFIIYNLDELLACAIVFLSLWNLFLKWSLINSLTITCCFVGSKTNLFSEFVQFSVYDTYFIKDFIAIVSGMSFYLFMPSGLLYPYQMDESFFQLWEFSFYHFYFTLRKENIFSFAVSVDLVLKRLIWNCTACLCHISYYLWNVRKDLWQYQC